MALFYNNDGTVSSIVINAIIDGKVTSSAEQIPTIKESLYTSASNAIISGAMAAGSSSAVAYGLGYPTSTNGWTLVNGVLTSPKNK